jgi:uncharacterized membrane protein (Fun14 family)
MTADDRLLYETRVRNRSAALAATAGILLVVAAVVQLAGPHTKVDELTADLIYAHKRFPLDVIGSLINAIGLLAVGGTLVFLFDASRARKPELKPFIKYATIVGAVLAALTGLAYAVVIAIKSNQFVSHGSQTYEQAHSLTSSAIVLILPFLGQAAAFLLALGFVMVALNAMRIGLLTRFMGYLGIFTGVLVIFPIGSPVPVVQGFWLLALAYLFSGRWPSGLPPAWRSGRAEPWPSSAQLREQRAGAAGARGGRGGVSKPARSAPEKVAAPSARNARAGTSKRKRKRRK